MKKFHGKVVWITGGGSGIGKALALEWVRQGATVAVSGRRQERLQQVVQEIEASGGKALAIHCDVTDEEAVEVAVATVVRELGQLDVAVANAGMGVTGRVEKLAAADWRHQLEVNVIGTAVVAKAALPHLRASRGRLALVGSAMSFMTAPGSGAYAVSKYAVRALGQTLAMELHGSGVSCTVIYPGFVASEIAQVDNRGLFHADRKDLRPKALMWPADKAARVIVRAVARRRRNFVFTAHGRFIAWVGQHMPWLIHFAFTRFSKPGR